MSVALHIRTEYSHLIVLSRNAHKRLLEAKNLRCEKSGLHYQVEQTSLIPDNIDDRPTISPDFTGGTPIFSVFPQSPGSVT